MSESLPLATQQSSVCSQLKRKSWPKPTIWSWPPAIWLPKRSRLMRRYAELSLEASADRRNSRGPL